MKTISITQVMLDRILVAGVESQEYELIEFALENGADVNFRNCRSIRRLLEKGCLESEGINLLLKLVMLAKPENLNAPNCCGNTVITLLEGLRPDSPFYHEPKPLAPRHIIDLVTRISKEFKGEK